MAPLFRNQIVELLLTPGIRLDGVLFLNVRLKKEGGTGRSDLPRLRLVSVVWLVFWFCFVFETKKSNKYSPAVGACPIPAGLSL